MAPVNLFYTCKAEDDLDSIFNYLAENNPTAAFDYIERMRWAIENLSISPCMGIDCKSKGIDRDCGALIFEKYLIFYQFNKGSNEIAILRILHGSRRYQDLLT